MILIKSASIFMILASLITTLDIIVGMTFSIEDSRTTSLQYSYLFKESKFLGLYYTDLTNVDLLRDFKI